LRKVSAPVGATGVRTTARRKGLAEYIGDPLQAGVCAWPLKGPLETKRCPDIGGIIVQTKADPCADGRQWMDHLADADFRDLRSDPAFQLLFPDIIGQQQGVRSQADIIADDGFEAVLPMA
jgi:hypothetical protein